MGSFPKVGKERSSSEAAFELSSNPKTKRILASLTSLNSTTIHVIAMKQRMEPVTPRLSAKTREGKPRVAAPKDMECVVFLRNHAATRSVRIQRISNPLQDSPVHVICGCANVKVILPN